jgi:hypothetical protein
MRGENGHTQYGIRRGGTAIDRQCGVANLCLVDGVSARCVAYGGHTQAPAHQVVIPTEGRNPCAKRYPH